MADLRKEDGLGKHDASEEDVETKATEDRKEEESQEPKLPKLSAADFKTYNSMAETMNYYVRSLSLHQYIRSQNAI